MQTDTPGQHFLPSEICRLVLGFLKEGGYMRTYHNFRKECVHLREYDSLLRRGQQYPTTIMGLSLLMMLDEYAKLKLTPNVTSVDVSVPPLTPRNRTSTSFLKDQSVRTAPQKYRSKALLRSRKGRPSRFFPHSCDKQARFGKTLDHAAGGLSVDLIETSSCSSEGSVDVDVDVEEVPCTSTPAGGKRAAALNNTIPSNSEETPVSCVSSSISSTSGFHSDTALQVNGRQSESQEAGQVSWGTQEQRTSGLTNDRDGSAERLHAGQAGQVPEVSGSCGGASDSRTAGQTRALLALSTPVRPSSACPSRRTQSTLQTGYPSNNDPAHLHSGEKDGYDPSTSTEAASKRRKKPPRRRAESDESTTARGSKGPVAKMINSSRFVKTLVDNINTCLYDSHKHTHQQSSSAAAASIPDKDTAAPVSQPGPSTAGTIVSDNNSLEEEFDFLNKDVTKDTVSTIINMSSTDPIFKELFDIFNTDGDELINRYCGKGDSSECKQDDCEGLHTPPHCSEAEADMAMTGYLAPLTMPSTSSGHPATPSTSSPSFQQPHPAAISFSTECIDLSSMPGFPNIGDSPVDQGSAVSADHQQGLPRVSALDSAGADYPDSVPGWSTVRAQKELVSARSSGSTESLKAASHVCSEGIESDTCEPGIQVSSQRTSKPSSPDDDRQCGVLATAEQNSSTISQYNQCEGAQLSSSGTKETEILKTSLSLTQRHDMGLGEIGEKHTLSETTTEFLENSKQVLETETTNFDRNPPKEKSVSRLIPETETAQHDAPATFLITELEEDEEEVTVSHPQECQGCLPDEADNTGFAAQDTQILGALSSCGNSKGSLLPAPVVGSSEGIAHQAETVLIRSEHNYFQGVGGEPKQGRNQNTWEEVTNSPSNVSFPDTSHVSDTEPMTPQRSSWGNLAMVAASESSNSDSQVAFDGTCSGAVVIGPNSSHRPVSVAPTVSHSEDVIVIAQVEHIADTGITPVTLRVPDTEDDEGDQCMELEASEENRCSLTSYTVTSSVTALPPDSSTVYANADITIMLNPDAEIKKSSHLAVEKSISSEAFQETEYSQSETFGQRKSSENVSQAVAVVPTAIENISTEGSNLVSKSVRGHSASMELQSSESGHTATGATMDSPEKLPTCSADSLPHASMQVCLPALQPSIVETSQPLNNVETVLENQGTDVRSCPVSAGQDLAVVPTCSSVTVPCSSVLTSMSGAVTVSRCVGSSAIACQVLLVPAVSSSCPHFSQIPACPSHVMTRCLSSEKTSCISESPQVEIHQESGDLQDSEHCPQTANVNLLLTGKGQLSQVNELPSYGRAHVSPYKTSLVSTCVSLVNTTCVSTNFTSSSPVKSTTGILERQLDNKATVISKSCATLSSTDVHRSPLMSVSPSHQTAAAMTHLQPNGSPLCFRKSPEKQQLSCQKSTEESRDIPFGSVSQEVEDSMTQGGSRSKQNICNTSPPTSSPSEKTDLTFTQKTDQPGSPHCSVLGVKENMTAQASSKVSSCLKNSRTSSLCRSAASSQLPLTNATPTKEGRDSENVYDVQHSSPIADGFDENDQSESKSTHSSEILQQKHRTPKRHRRTGDASQKKPSNCSSSSEHSACHQVDERGSQCGGENHLSIVKSCTDHDQSSVQKSPGKSEMHKVADQGMLHEGLPGSSHPCMKAQNSHPPPLPHSPPRPEVCLSEKNATLFQTPPKARVATPQHAAARTPRRSFPGTPGSYYPRTPPRSARGTPVYSPLKSPYSPGTAAALSLILSPRRKKLLSEPIPEEVFDEISMHSDSNLSDACSGNRPGSSCSNPEKMGGPVEADVDDVYQTQDQTKVQSVIVASSGSDGISSHLMAVSESVTKVNVTPASSESHEQAEEEECGRLSASSHCTSDSFYENNFRPVGMVEGPFIQPVTAQILPEQQQGKLSNVGEMSAATGDSSRQAATIFSTHVTAQPLDQETKGLVGNVGETARFVESRVDGNKELSQSDIFISHGGIEEACKTNISMPILPLNVAQFLNSQIEAGELEVPDFTTDLTLLKTPTPEKRTPRKPTPRRSPRNSLHQVSAQIGNFASMPRKKPESPKKMVRRKLLSDMHLESPPKRTHNQRQHLRHFASVSQHNSPQPEEMAVNCRGCNASMENRKAMKHKPGRAAKKAAEAPTEKKSRKLITKKKRVEMKSPGSSSSDSDNFSIHSCASTESESFSSEDNLPLSEIAKKSLQRKKVVSVKCEQMKTRSSDKLCRARHSTQPERHQETHKYNTNETYHSHDLLSVISDMPDRDLDVIMKESKSSRNSAVLTKDVSTKRPVDQVAVSGKPVTSYYATSSRNLPLKKRPVGRKNLSLLRDDIQSIETEKSVKTAPHTADTNTREEEENSHSALSKVSHGGSSSIEVDICELSEEDMDSSDREELPALQSVRKKLAIISAKKSAAGKKKLAKSKARRRISLRKGGSGNGNQAAKASTSTATLKTESSPLQQRDGLEVKKCAKSQMCEKVLSKGDKCVISKSQKGSAEKLASSSKKSVSNAQLVPRSTEDPDSATADSSARQTGRGGGLGQQNQTYCYTGVLQPKVVGIHKYGPYRRIKPVLLSKTTTSYFPSIKRRAQQLSESAFEVESVASPVFSAFSSAPSPMTSEVSSGFFSPAIHQHQSWPQSPFPQPSLPTGSSAGVPCAAASKTASHSVTSKPSGGCSGAEVSSSAKSMGLTSSSDARNTAERVQGGAAVQESKKESSHIWGKSSSETRTVEKVLSEMIDQRSVEDHNQQNENEGHLDEGGQKAAVQSSKRAGGSKTTVTRTSTSKKHDFKQKETVLSPHVYQSTTRKMNSSSKRSAIQKSSVEDEQNRVSDVHVDSENKVKSDQKQKICTISTAHDKHLDASSKSVKEAADELNTDLCAEKKSSSKRTKQRTRKSSKDKPKSRGTKRKKMETGKNNSGLEELCLESMHMHDLPQREIEKETTSNHQACDSFETEEAVRAIEELNAVENDSAKTDLQHRSAESANNEHMLEMQIMRPDNVDEEILTGRADTECEIMGEEGRGSNFVRTEGDRNGESHTGEVMQSTREENARIIEKSVVDVGREPPQKRHLEEKAETSTRVRGNFLRSNQQNTNCTDSVDSCDFQLLDLVSANSEQTSNSKPSSTLTRKHRASSPISVPCKKTRTDNTDKDDCSQGKSGTVFRQPFKTPPKSDVKKWGNTGDSGHLSMPFLVVSRSPTKFGSNASNKTNNCEPESAVHVQKEVPSNSTSGEHNLKAGTVVRIEERTPTNATQVADPEGHISLFDGGSVMNKFSSLLNQVEREDHCFINRQEANTASENAQPPPGCEAPEPQSIDQGRGSFAQQWKHLYNQSVVTRQLISVTDTPNPEQLSVSSTPVNTKQTPIADGGVPFVGSESVMDKFLDKFSVILNQAESQNQECVGDVGSSNIASDSAQPTSSGCGTVEEVQPIYQEREAFAQQTNHHHLSGVTQQSDTTLNSQAPLQLSASAKLLQLAQELQEMRKDKYKTRTQKRRETKIKDGVCPKRPKRKRISSKCQTAPQGPPQPSLLVSVPVLPVISAAVSPVLPMDVASGETSPGRGQQRSKYRPIFPKQTIPSQRADLVLPSGGLSVCTENVDNSSVSITPTKRTLPVASNVLTSTAHPQKGMTSVNPLDAAMMSVLPELAAGQSADTHGLLQLTQASGIVQTIQEAVPNGPDDVEGFLRYKEITAVNKPTEYVRESDCSDGTSPHRLIIDDSHYSGQESSPNRWIKKQKLPADEKNREVARQGSISEQPTKKPVLKVPQQEKIGKRLHQNPKTSQRKVPKQLLPEFNATQGNPDQHHTEKSAVLANEEMQTASHVLTSGIRQTTRQTIPQTISPTTLQNGGVSESDKTDTLEHAVPSSVFPSVSPNSEQSHLDRTSQSHVRGFLDDSTQGLMKSQHFFGREENSMQPPAKLEELVSVSVSSTTAVNSEAFQPCLVSEGFTSKETEAVTALTESVLPTVQDVAGQAETLLQTPPHSTSAVFLQPALPVSSEPNSTSSTQRQSLCDVNPHHHLTQTMSSNTGSVASSTSVKARVYLGQGSPALSEGYESPRQEVAKVLASMDFIETKRRGQDGVDGAPKEHSAKTPSSNSSSPTKTGRLNSINIDKFLKKAVQD